MRSKISFFERQYNKNETKYCAKYGRLKYLEINSKNFRRILFIIIMSLVSSLGSLLLAIFYPFENFGILGNFIRLFWYTGFGIFITSTVVFSARLPFYKRKSKEHKEELLRLKSGGEQANGR